MTVPEKEKREHPAERKRPNGGHQGRPDPSSTNEKLDEALDETFPASDPIAVTPRRQDKDQKRERCRQ